MGMAYRSYLDDMGWVILKVWLTLAIHQPPLHRYHVLRYWWPQTTHWMMLKHNMISRHCDHTSNLNDHLWRTRTRTCRCYSIDMVTWKKTRYSPSFYLRYSCLVEVYRAQKFNIDYICAWNPSVKGAFPSKGRGSRRLSAQINFHEKQYLLDRLLESCHTTRSQQVIMLIKGACGFTTLHRPATIPYFPNRPTGSPFFLIFLSYVPYRTMDI